MWHWSCPRKADIVFLQPFLRWILQELKIECVCMCVCACARAHVRMCFKASFCHKCKRSPVLETPLSKVQPYLPSKHSRPPASRPPRSRMSVVHLCRNDSCLSRSTWEALLAAVTSMPSPRLSFSGVSTTHCSKICSDMNQASSWLLLPQTPLCSDTNGSCSAPRVCFTQLFVCHLEAQDVEQVLWRYFWPDAQAESIMRPSGEGLFCQLVLGWCAAEKPE